MILIDVSDSSNQKIDVSFTGGSVTVSMYYSFINSSWFMSVSYGNYTVNNILVEYGVNLTYPFRHMFPFGIVCATNSELRPLYLDSFSSMEANLVLLEGEEDINI